MGMIERQGIWNTVLSYAGAVIGVINVIFLYPFFFQTDEIGLIRILTSVSLLYAHLASFGLNSIILRFSPHYKDRPSGFIFGVLIIAAIAFTVSTVILFLLKPIIVPIYAENSGLLVEYYNWLVPLAMFTLVFNLTETILRMTFRTVFSLFCREILLRILTLLGIIGVAYDILLFETFMIWFLLIHAAIALLVLFQLLRFNEINRPLVSLAPVKSFFNRRRLSLILKYGFVSLLTGATTYLIQMIDAVMVGAYLDLEQVGIYTVAFFMGSVIAMPARGVTRIALPVVTNAWKKNQIGRIESLYQITSFLQFCIGALILGIILVNLDDIFRFLPAAFSGGFVVVMWIGIGYWIDMTGGLNSYILNTSPKYHVDMYFNVIFLVICIVTNAILIPLYRLEGAAIASASSYFSVNLFRTIYLQYAYKMRLFNWNYLFLLILIVTGCAPFYYLPIQDLNPLAAIAIRSACVLALTTGLLKATRTDKILLNSLLNLRNLEK